MNANQMSSTPRIKAIDPGMAKGKAKELLDAVVTKYGGAPNSFKTMAHSPAGFQGFLGLSATLEGGVLPFETRYQIAIAVSELNGARIVFPLLRPSARAQALRMKHSRRAGWSDRAIRKSTRC